MTITRDPEKLFFTSTDENGKYSIFNGDNTNKRYTQQNHG